jgi:hypothetical protein
MIGRAITGTELEVIFWTLFIWLNWFKVSSPRLSLRVSIRGFNVVQPETRFHFQSANQIARISEHSSMYLLLHVNKHGKRTDNFEVQPRKYCLSQSAKSKIPYHLITGYTDCPRVMVRTSENDIARAEGEGNIDFMVLVRTMTRGQSAYPDIALYYSNYCVLGCWYRPVQKPCIY